MRRNAMIDYDKGREISLDMGEMMMRFIYEVIINQKLLI